MNSALTRRLVRVTLRSLFVSKPYPVEQRGRMRTMCGRVLITQTWWLWCNGNTAGCGPVIVGSIPTSHPTKHPPIFGRMFCDVWGSNSKGFGETGRACFPTDGRGEFTRGRKSFREASETSAGDAPRVTPTRLEPREGADFSLGSYGASNS